MSGYWDPPHFPQPRTRRNNALAWREQYGRFIDVYYNSLFLLRELLALDRACCSTDPRDAKVTVAMTVMKKIPNELLKDIFLWWHDDETMVRVP